MTRRLRLAVAKVRSWWHERILGHTTFCLIVGGSGTVEESCRTCRRVFYRVPLEEVFGPDIAEAFRRKRNA